MNVLLISQAYPPYPVVGALRASKVAQALRAQGHRVIVITERLPGEDADLRQSAPDLQVHTVVVGLKYRLRVVALRARVRSLFGYRPGGAASLDRSGGAPAGPGAGNGASGNGFLRRLLLALLWLPDDEQRFILPAYRTARGLLRRSRVDVVYTTAPPFSTHLVGLLLRRRGGVRWVAEFRDPWTDQRGSHRWDGIAAIDAVHRWLELRCLHAADRVVAVTKSARDLLARKLPEAERHKVLFVLNGIDEVAARQPARGAGPFRIAYAGNFYMNRNPRPVLAALAAVMRRRDLTSADVAVDLVGGCRFFDDEPVDRMVSDYGLDDVVRFHDWMPQDQAQEILRRADLLLLIARGQPLQIPNKLFDYLGLRSPILALLDAGGESDCMLRRVGGHHVIAGPLGAEVDVAAVEAALEAALDEASASPAPVGNEEVLHEWLASRQMTVLVRAIAGETGP